MGYHDTDRLLSPGMWIRWAAEPPPLSLCADDKLAAFVPCNVDGSFHDIRRNDGRRRTEFFARTEEPNPAVCGTTGSTSSRTAYPVKTAYLLLMLLAGTIPLVGGMAEEYQRRNAVPGIVGIVAAELIGIGVGIPGIAYAENLLTVGKFISGLTVALIGVAFGIVAYYWEETIKPRLPDVAVRAESVAQGWTGDLVKFVLGALAAFLIVWFSASKQKVDLGQASSRINSLTSQLKASQSNEQQLQARIQETRARLAQVPTVLTEISKLESQEHDAEARLKAAADEVNATRAAADKAEKGDEENLKECRRRTPKDQISQCLNPGTYANSRNAQVIYKTAQSHQEQAQEDLKAIEGQITKERALLTAP
jgi:hypothetical protein